MKNLSAILALCLLISLNTACSFSAGKTGKVGVESAALAKDAGGKAGETVTGFSSSDKVQYFVVGLSEGKAGTHVKGVWTAVNAGDAVNTKIVETEVVTVDDEQNKANFHISMPDGFPAGDYKADFYLDDTLAKTINYKVQ